jgi:predicted nucleotidyltransferase
VCGVDVFATEPIPFEQLWQSADEMVIGGTPVRIASVEHLVAMKRAAGRPQDLRDVAELELLEQDHER